jgi:hypothetical protein
MDLKNLPPAMISQLANMVEDYVTSSRKKYAPQAVALTDAQHATMQPFFSAAILDSARLCVLRGTRVSNPSMYAMAKMMGIRARRPLHMRPHFHQVHARWPVCGLK